jgi:hypothetical protein
MSEDDPNLVNKHTSRKSAENVHGAASTQPAPPEVHPGDSADQTPVPKGDPGDPTRDTWERINREKVQTVKEEMPGTKPTGR